VDDGLESLLEVRAVGQGRQLVVIGTVRESADPVDQVA